MTTTATLAHPHTAAFTERLRLTGRGAALTVPALFGVVLLPVWVTFTALSPLTFVVPVALAAAAVVRRYANTYRRGAASVLGVGIAEPYRPRDGGLLRRLVGTVRDPASWRDAAWLLAKPAVGLGTGLIPVTLLLGTVFYLVFPFLYAVTPQAAFGHAFGFVTIGSVATAFAFVPLALVSFGIWWLVTPALARADVRFDRALLR